MMQGPCPLVTTYLTLNVLDQKAIQKLEQPDWLDTKFAPRMSSRGISILDSRPTGKIQLTATKIQCFGSAFNPPFSWRA